MTDKLTLQDCFKYPEAEIRHNSGGSFKDVFELIIRSYDANMSTLYMLADYDCKLILRSIEQLTDEERKHIDRLACINPITVRSNLKKSVLLIRYVIYESKELDYAIMKDDLQICDYLRSINIDIDDYLLSGKAVKG